MWPFSQQPSIRSLLENLVSASITAAQALADLQAASTANAAATQANAAAITQLGTDLNAFIAKSQAGGVDPIAAEAVVASIQASTQAATASAAAAQALDAIVNPPAPASGSPTASASAAAVKPRTS